MSLYVYKKEKEREKAGMNLLCFYLENDNHRIYNLQKGEKKKK